MSKGRKSSFDKILVLEMYKTGSTYKEIANELKISEGSIKMFIKRHAAELIENPLNKYEVMKLYNKGWKYKDIAKELNSTENAVKLVINRNIPKELRIDKKVDKKLFEPKEEEITLPVKGNLTVQDRKELMNEKRWGINTNESSSDYSFFKGNSQSYIPDKKNNRKYIFDEKRGSIQADLKTLYL